MLIFYILSVSSYCFSWLENSVARSLFILVSVPLKAMYLSLLLITFYSYYHTMPRHMFVSGFILFLVSWICKVYIYFPNMKNISTYEKLFHQVFSLVASLNLPSPHQFLRSTMIHGQMFNIISQVTEIIFNFSHSSLCHSLWSFLWSFLIC